MTHKEALKQFARCTRCRGGNKCRDCGQEKEGQTNDDRRLLEEVDAVPDVRELPDAGRAVPGL